MKNRELASGFADCLPGSKVFIINPGIDETDHERWGIGAIQYLTNSDPTETIIEAGADSMEVRTLLLGLKAIGSPDGDVQIFVKGWEGQDFAYFDIKEVRRGPYHHSIILGAWRCGG